MYYDDAVRYKKTTGTIIESTGDANLLMKTSTYYWYNKAKHTIRFFTKAS